MPMYVVWYASPYPVRDVAESYFVFDYAAEALVRELSALNFEVRLQVIDVPLSV